MVTDRILGVLWRCLRGHCRGERKESSHQCLPAHLLAPHFQKSIISTLTVFGVFENGLEKNCRPLYYEVINTSFSTLRPLQNTDTSLSVLVSHCWCHQMLGAISHAIRHLADGHCWHSCVSHMGIDTHDSGGQMRESFCIWSRGRRCAQGMIHASMGNICQVPCISVFWLPKLPCLGSTRFHMEKQWRPSGSWKCLPFLLTLKLFYGQLQNDDPMVAESYEA